MGLKLIAIVALLWLGVVIAARLRHPAREGNPVPRWGLNIVVLSIVLGVAGPLFVRFALRSGNVALMLVASLLVVGLAVAFGWYVVRALKGR